MLMYELADAQEHLASLIADMENDPDYDETEFKIDLAHIYAHLNRAWKCRNFEEGLGLPWHLTNQFPKDLEPL